MERRDCQVLTVRVTTPSTIVAAAQRQGWSKIATRTTVEKFVNQCCSFEHAGVIDKAASGVTLGWVWREHTFYMTYVTDIQTDMQANSHENNTSLAEGNNLSCYSLEMVDRRSLNRE